MAEVLSASVQGRMGLASLAAGNADGQREEATGHHSADDGDEGSASKVQAAVQRQGSDAVGSVIFSVGVTLTVWAMLVAQVAGAACWCEKHRRRVFAPAL